MRVEGVWDESVDTNGVGSRHDQILLPTVEEVAVGRYFDAGGRVEFLADGKHGSQ